MQLGDDSRMTRRELLRNSLLAAGGIALTKAGLAVGSSRTGNQALRKSDALLEAPNSIEAALAAAQRRTAFSPPGPPVDAAKAHGASVFYLGQNLSVPIIRQFADGVAAACTVAGLAHTIFDGEGSTSLYSEGINEAISEKVDCLIIDSISTASLTAPIAAAKAKGIKIVSASGDLAGRPPSAGGPAHGVDALSGTDFVGGARLEAEWVLSDAAGRHIDCVIVSFPGNPILPAMVSAIKGTLDTFAKGNKTHTLSVDPTEWSTRLPTLTSSLVTGDSSINYFIVCVDAPALDIVPALHTSGFADKVKISTLNATPAVMKLLAQGNVVGADIGTPPTWLGYADVDQALRLLTGMKPLPAGTGNPEHVPLRLFDRHNIASINVNGNDADWYDTQSAVTGYKRLWGLR